MRHEPAADQPEPGPGQGQGHDRLESAKAISTRSDPRPTDYEPSANPEPA